MRQGYHTDGGLSERQPGLGTVNRDGYHKHDAVGELLTNYSFTVHQHGGREIVCPRQTPLTAASQLQRHQD
jgi:hypothetical protein